MYGLPAIQQANGWAMAGAGTCIVIIGLGVLAFLISMLPRLTRLFEEKASSPAATEVQPTFKKMVVPEKLPQDIHAASRIYIALTEDLGEDFSLIDLHRKSKAVGLPHPHLSFNRFRDAGILVSKGEERFSWKPPSV